MDDTPGAVVEEGPEDQQAGDNETGYLEEIIKAMTPQERIEASMILQSYMQKDRQSGTLNLDDDETAGGVPPMESGESDHMQELGR